MNKTKIVIATIGHMPNFNQKKISNYESSVFEIVGDIENYTLNRNADGTDWEYTDNNLDSIIPKQYNGDFLVAIVNVPIEENFYTRRLSKNRIIFSFFELKDFLKDFNIPLENAILRLLYAYNLIYKRTAGKIPPTAYNVLFSHDETRGCLFDMNGHKTDLIYSCHKPIICSGCVERLRQENVSDNVISLSQKEIKKIKKELFYTISSFVKEHPLWSIGISVIAAVLINLFSTYIFEKFLK